MHPIESVGPITNQINNLEVIGSNPDEIEMLHLQLDWFGDKYEVHESEAVDFIAICQEVSVIKTADYLFDYYFVLQYYLLWEFRLWQLPFTFSAVKHFIIYSDNDCMMVHCCEEFNFVCRQNRCKLADILSLTQTKLTKTVITTPKQSATLIQLHLKIDRLFLYIY